MLICREIWLLRRSRQDNCELPQTWWKKFDDSANSLWKYLRRLVFSSFLSLTPLWLYLLENGAFMKLCKNLITAARRMLLCKTNTVRVYTTARDGICAALNNIPLKLLLSDLLFFDGCGNVVSVVDTMFLLLISAASNRQNKAHNCSNISTFFNVGALRVPQVSLKVSFTGTGLRSTSVAAPTRRSALQRQLPLLPLNTSTVPQWGARGGVLASSSSPMTSDTASDTSGPSAGVFPSEPDNAGSALSLITRQETHLHGSAWLAPPLPPFPRGKKTEWRSNRRGRYQKFPSAWGSSISAGGGGVLLSGRDKCGCSQEGVKNGPRAGFFHSYF